MQVGCHLNSYNVSLVHHVDANYRSGEMFHVTGIGRLPCGRELLGKLQTADVRICN